MESPGRPAHNNMGSAGVGYSIPGVKGEYILPDGTGKICYDPEFLGKEHADAVLEATRNARSWERKPIKFYGNDIVQPRDTAFFGTVLYSYSDEAKTPTGWNEDPPASTALKDLALKIETCLNLPKDWFNVILANKYYHGKDFMGWHADDEASLGDEPVIASVSLGAERRFLFRTKPGFSKSAQHPKIEYILTHGSLLVMSGKVQQFYQHSLPKVSRSKCDSLRLNFTFRHAFQR